MRQRGATYERIAKEVGITFGGVSKILERLHKRYVKNNLDQVERIRTEQICELSHIADEAFQAWERSKKKLEHNPDLDGDSKYLTVYLKAKEDLRKITGADAPAKTENKNTNTDTNKHIEVDQVIAEIKNQIGKDAK